MELIDRFTAKYVVNQETGCWEWTASTYQGYGQFRYPNGKKAHRFSYEWFNETILGDLNIDHLCKNKKCVNPEHLEAVSREENTRRRNINEYVYQTKDICKNGHSVIENAYVRPDGYTECKICRSERTSKYRQDNRESYNNYMKAYYHKKKGEQE